MNTRMLEPVYLCRRHANDLRANPLRNLIKGRNFIMEDITFKKVKKIIQDEFPYCNCFGSEYSYLATLNDTTQKIMRALTESSRVELPVIVKIAEELKELITAADSILTLFAFSPHIFLQEDKLEERKKEAERIGFGLRKIKESIFSA